MNTRLAHTLFVALILAAAGSGQAATPCELAKLLASDAAAGDHFGESVAISGDTAVVGAPWDDGPAGAARVHARSLGGAICLSLPPRAIE